MTAFTGSGYSVQNLIALKAILAIDRPAFKVALLVGSLGWYEYDNTATTGGIVPDDNPVSGRWFPIQSRPDVGTTALRQINPPNMTERFNTDLRCFEHYINGTWIGQRYGVSYAPFSVSMSFSSGSNVTGAIYLPARQELFVSNTSATSTIRVRSISRLNGTEKRTINVAANCLNMIYSSVNDRLYLSNVDNLYAVNPDSGAIDATIVPSVGGNSSTQNPLYYCPSNALIYFGRGVGQAGGIAVIDPVTNTQIAFIQVQDPFNPQNFMWFSEITTVPLDIGNFLYFAGYAGYIVKVNKSDNSFTLLSPPADFPYITSTLPLLFCPTQNKIYYAQTGSAPRSILVYNLSTGLVANNIILPTGAFANTFLVAAPIVYVPSTDTILLFGTAITAIDPNTNTILFEKSLFPNEQSGRAFFSTIYNSVFINGSFINPYTYDRRQVDTPAGFSVLEIPDKKYFLLRRSGSTTISIF